MRTVEATPEPWTPTAGPRARDDLAVDARGLTKWFGDLVAVSGVTFSVQPGEIFGPWTERLPEVGDDQDAVHAPAADRRSVYRG
ncbi:MAG TPA: hypothetical protein VEQ37_19990 [Actinomycetota bacterium]|nr:hypothetical protein [Actinomycetota bacterium]